MQTVKTAGEDMPLRVNNFRLSNQTVHGCEKNGVEIRFRCGLKLAGLYFWFPVSRKKFLRGFVERQFIPMPGNMNPDHAPPFIDVNVIYCDGAVCYIAKKRGEQ